MRLAKITEARPACRHCAKCHQEKQTDNNAGSNFYRDIDDDSFLPREFCPTCAAAINAIETEYEAAKYAANAAYQHLRSCQMYGHLAKEEPEAERKMQQARERLNKARAATGKAEA